MSHYEQRMYFNRFISCLDINATLPIRLVSGQSNYGRIEVYYNQSWTSICYNNFDRNDGLVACRSLGFSNVSSYHCCSHGYPPQAASIYISNVNCTGQESSLSQCSYSIANNSICNQYSTVSVTCVGEIHLLSYRVYR